MNSSLMISELKETAKFSKTGANIISLILQVHQAPLQTGWLAPENDGLAASHETFLDFLSTHKYMHTCLKGPTHEHEKTLAKHRGAKTLQPHE